MLHDTIAVIDDDIRSLEGLRLVFEKTYEVLTFRSGEEALAHLSGPNKVRLLLVDVLMKGLDGIGVLRRVREISRDMPVIIMTAYGSKEIVIRALQNGATDFVEKPFNVAELREKIRTLLERVRPFVPEKERVADRMKYFVEHNAADVQLKDLARQSTLTPKYVSRLFREKTRRSFRDYKLEVKISRAKDLLTSTSSSITEIARMLGYQNPESFMRMFKSHTGLTPGEFRNKK